MAPSARFAGARLRCAGRSGAVSASVRVGEAAEGCVRAFSCVRALSCVRGWGWLQMVAGVPLRASVGVVSGLSVLAGCSASVAPSYDDPTPEARLGAMRAAVARGADAGTAGGNDSGPADRAATGSTPGSRADLPRLVECLASDDPAVRLGAIGVLERMTGTTLGYRASAPPAERARAVERWKAFVAQDGELASTSAPASKAPPSSVPAGSSPSAPAKR